MMTTARRDGQHGIQQLSDGEWVAQAALDEVRRLLIDGQGVVA